MLTCIRREAFTTKYCECLSREESGYIGNPGPSTRAKIEKGRKMSHVNDEPFDRSDHLHEETKRKKLLVADTSQTAFIGKTFALHTVEFTTAVHILFRIKRIPSPFHHIYPLSLVCAKTASFLFLLRLK